MKFNRKYVVLLLAGLLLAACSGQREVEITPDNTSLIRNPAMGWGLYTESTIPDASSFWDGYGDIPQKYCSFLYIRAFWSELEPEEGRYAWIYDENYKALIESARERGLKLHFRVFYDSQDSHRMVTPEYVRQAGAEGFLTNHGIWSPYADDPVFQEKLAKFLKAFAEEYDDPSVVDCIDAYNLGWWGEGHHVTLKNRNSFRETSLKIAGIYSDTFKNVLLAINYHNEITEPVLAEILEKYDFILRHDAFGSQWYGDFEVSFAEKYGFPKRPVIAESCYWFVGRDKGQTINADGIDDTERWRKDEKHPGMESWRDCYVATYNDAEQAHANTLDLRQVREALSWTTEAPDIVEKFKINGGYRFTPVSVKYDKVIRPGREGSICHSWINSGFGLFPGNNSRWHDKYHPAFALLDANCNLVRILEIDTNANPSDWVQGRTYTYRSSFVTDSIAPGKYRLALCIYDNLLGRPGINLSSSETVVVDGWTIIGDIRVGRSLFPCHSGRAK